MKKFETVNEIVDHYFSSGSSFKSIIFSALGSLFCLELSLDDVKDINCNSIDSL